MTSRWLCLLTAGIILSALSSGIYFRTQQLNGEQLASTRATRVQMQSVDQTVQILKTSDNLSTLHRFNDSIQTLQIEVSQMLDNVDGSQDIEIRTFEQSLLPSGFLSPYGQHIQTIRLSVLLSASHVVALLNALHGFSNSLLPWPLEVRSCDVARSPEQQLNARCVIDIYHWSGES